MRTRIFNKMTNEEVEEYLNSGGDTLFFGIGVTELHGHLPIDCEAIITEAVALKMAEKANGLAVINLPFFCAGSTAIGRSTVNVSVHAGYEYLKAIVYSFYKQGFKKMFFITSHAPAYLTVNPVCMDFFHETHNAICHIDMMHAMNVATENGWKPEIDRRQLLTNMMYGAYQTMGQLQFIPVLTNVDEEAFLAKRKAGNEKQWFKKDLHKLDFCSGLFGSYFHELEEHGGLEYSKSEEERAQRGAEGEQLLNDFVEAFDAQHFADLLQELDRAVEEDIVPKYPHLELDPFKPYK